MTFRKESNCGRTACALDFCKAENLLAKLFELSKAAANDFEAFRDAAEGR